MLPSSQPQPQPAQRQPLFLLGQRYFVSSTATTGIK
jgi:hypothetical protein